MPLLTPRRGEGHPALFDGEPCDQIAAVTANSTK